MLSCLVSRQQVPPNLLAELMTLSKYYTTLLLYKSIIFQHYATTYETSRAVGLYFARFSLSLYTACLLSCFCVFISIGIGYRASKHATLQ